MRQWPAFVLLVSLACSAWAGAETEHLTEQELLSGSALFAAPVERAELPQVDILALTDEMRDFVARNTGDTPDQLLKLRRLSAAMLREGLLSIDYDADMTRTAAETFRDRRGNCLAFTTMFIALAREAGIDARYQMVDIPPVWLGTSDLVVLNQHVNVVARIGRREYVVDFNETDVDPHYDRAAISDAYALGLYHSNQAVDALKEKDTRRAFTHLLRAIQADRTIPSPWVNLGVLYARNGQFAHAEAAYRATLSRERDNMSALTNLTRLYAAQGREDLVTRYRAKVQRYQRKNPYYHHWLARRAYADGRLQEAMDDIRRAIKLRRDEHRFHHLEAVLHYAMGDRANAARSFARARRAAQPEELKRSYNAKLEALKSNG